MSIVLTRRTALESMYLDEFPFVYQRLYLCQILFHFTDLSTPHFLFKDVGSRKHGVCLYSLLSTTFRITQCLKGRAVRAATIVTLSKCDLHCVYNKTWNACACPHVHVVAIFMWLYLGTKEVLSQNERIQITLQVGWGHDMN